MYGLVIYSVQYRYYHTEPYTYFLVGMTQKEAIESKKAIYVTLLDVSKAFDVVDHDILLEELYKSGIGGDLWLTFKQSSQPCERHQMEWLYFQQF